MSGDQDSDQRLAAGVNDGVRRISWMTIQQSAYKRRAGPVRPSDNDPVANMWHPTRMAEDFQNDLATPA